MPTETAMAPSRWDTRSRTSTPATSSWLILQRPHTTNQHIPIAMISIYKKNLEFDTTVARFIPRSVLLGACFDARSHGRNRECAHLAQRQGR